jgi:hypothetical protein
MNFIEQLTAEYYELTGYWVRKNVRGKKAELDILAYRPSDGELVH